MERAQAEEQILELFCLLNRPGWFGTVGGDMKVEQTIQRVSAGH